MTLTSERFSENDDMRSIVGMAVHEIRRQGREYGCNKCNEHSTPGFMSAPIPYLLSDAWYAQRVMDENTFCSCQTGANLLAAAMKRVGVNEKDVSAVQARGAMRNEIDRLFNGWGYPSQLEGYNIKTWNAKFGQDPTKSDAKQALLQLGRTGKIETPNGEWPGLLLHGSAGAGKTGGAAGIVQKWDNDGVPSLFITLNDILLLTNWQDDKEAVRRRMSLLSRVPSLGIDELVHPGQNISDHERTKIIFPILDNRYKRKLPTVATTNCTLAEIKEKLGTMTYERLLTLCAPVQVGGESGRQIVDSAF